MIKVSRSVNITKGPVSNYIAQKMKFCIKDFFSKCAQIRRKLRIWSHLLKKFLMENFIFCAVLIKMLQMDNSFFKRLTLSLCVTSWVGDNTDLPSKIKISKTIRLNGNFHNHLLERVFNKLSDSPVDRLCTYGSMVVDA